MTAKVPQDVAGLAESLRAIQTDIDVQQAIAITMDMSDRATSPQRTQHTTDQITRQLMAALRTNGGEQVQWPPQRQGQQYNPLIRAVRLMMEYVAQRKLVLEGTPKSRQTLIEIPKNCTGDYGQSITINKTSHPKMRRYRNDARDQHKRLGILTTKARETRYQRRAKPAQMKAVSIELH